MAKKIDTKQKRLSHCRYYRGQEQCPYSRDDGHMMWFWEMERVYVANGGFTGEGDDYRAYGGKEFSGIPRSLLYVMFTSWGKSTYDMQASLPEFYSLVDEYLEIASDHFPKDKIPE